MQNTSAIPSRGTLPLATPRARRIAFATALLGVVLLGAITSQALFIDASQLARFDGFCAAWALRHIGPAWVPLMRGISFVHGTAGTLVLSALLGTLLYHRCEWWWWRDLVLTVPGGMLLNAWLKEIFQRPRPLGVDPLYLPNSFSFPSGHAAYAWLFYGFLIVWLFNRAPPLAAPARYLAAVAAALACFMVGASRVGLGLHFASDVMAGAVEACAWIAICLMLTGFLAHRAHHGTTG
jgi:membrane-associated phospholipid phosphatase